MADKTPPDELTVSLAPQISGIVSESPQPPDDESFMVASKWCDVSRSDVSRTGRWSNSNYEAKLCRLSDGEAYLEGEKG